MPLPSNPLLERYKATLASGRPNTCTPSVDKAGNWSWRGKKLELVWDAIMRAEWVDKIHTTQCAEEGFTDRFEVTSGETKVFAGNAANSDKDHQVAFAVVFSAGKAGDMSGVDQVLELPSPLAFVCVHLLTTFHRIFLTRDRVLALLSARATSAREDVLECVSWMRERISAVDRSPQAILTRCAEIQRTAKEMHAHYLKQVQTRRASGGATPGAMGVSTRSALEESQEESCKEGTAAELREPHKEKVVEIMEQDGESAEAAEAEEAEGEEAEGEEGEGGEGEVQEGKRSVERSAQHTHT